MSGPERIGIPTGEPGKPRQRHCPGALLRVTRSDYAVLRREGQLWVTGTDDIREDGMSDARAFCQNDVAERVQSGMVYYMGLCKTCGELERNNRKDLASRAVHR